MTGDHTAVLVMTRAPRPGRTKTRLQPWLGADGCARLQRALIRHTAAIAWVAAPGELYVAVDPPDAAGELRDLLPAGAVVFGQQGPDLGARIRAAAIGVAAAHEGPLIVIGTDAPTMTPTAIRDAAGLVRDGRQVVFGPALDGGYYLVALGLSGGSSTAMGVLDLDPACWGGPRVLGASLSAARSAGLRVGMLAPLRDLDTPDDARVLLKDPCLPEQVARVLAMAVRP